MVMCVYSWIGEIMNSPKEYDVHIVIMYQKILISGSTDK